MKTFLRSYAIPLILLPLLTAAGIVVAGSGAWAFICAACALLACVPFFLTFEHKKHGTRRLAIIAVLTALSVAGRLAFAAVPAFKPVTAIVIITGMYLGSEAGFMTGALSAVLSNFYFGQGPWTPFQMLGWGLIGFFAGVASKGLKKNRLFPVLFAVVGGAVFSLVMDVWTVVWYNESFSPEMFVTAVTTSLPFTALYAVSNAVFIAVLEKPIGKKLDRLIVKYGI